MKIRSYTIPIGEGCESLEITEVLSISRPLGDCACHACLLRLPHMLIALPNMTITPVSNATSAFHGPSTHLDAFTSAPQTPPSAPASCQIYHILLPPHSAA